MAETGSEHRLVRYARAATHSLGEFVHVSAIYLGIAVLVTLGLSITVPSLREQSQQMHAALLAALRPDALGDDTIGSLDQGENDFFSVVAASASDSSSGSGADTPAEPDAEPQKPPAADLSSPVNFSHALSKANGRLSIPGVTGAQAQALRSYIARKYKIANSVAGVLIKTAFTVGKEQRLDPQLLLAVIAIESRYNPFAESHVGAQGLMQVMTKVHKDKFTQYAEGTVAALNPIANIRVGAQILYDCIKRRGSVKGGLACYVGAVGPGDGGYGAKVLAERRRIALASGIPIGPDVASTKNGSG